MAVHIMTWNCMLKASWIAVPFNYANRHTAPISRQFKIWWLISYISCQVLKFRPASTPL